MTLEATLERIAVALEKIATGNTTLSGTPGAPTLLVEPNEPTSPPDTALTGAGEDTPQPSQAAEEAQKPARTRTRKADKDPAPAAAPEAPAAPAPAPAPEPAAATTFDDVKAAAQAFAQAGATRDDVLPLFGQLGIKILSDLEKTPEQWQRALELLKTATAAKLNATGA